MNNNNKNTKTNINFSQYKEMLKTLDEIKKGIKSFEKKGFKNQTSAVYSYDMIKEMLSKFNNFDILGRKSMNLSHELDTLKEAQDKHEYEEQLLSVKAFYYSLCSKVHESYGSLRAKLSESKMNTCIRRLANY